jgi:hypothetical protein
MKKINYDSNVYQFKEIISRIFECTDLSKIHKKFEIDEISKKSIIDTHKFQQSEYHQIYYKNFSQIKPLYEKFILEVIKKEYDGQNLIYQSIPTFRLHFPNGLSVGMFHKDKDLRDEEWHKSIKEDNYYLPFTNSYDTNTIWYETEEDKGDFVPMECNYGQVVKWDGTNLTHGNKINTTEDTRISIDFRVATEENFKNSIKKSKNEKTFFVLGGYYSKL